MEIFDIRDLSFSYPQADDPVLRHIDLRIKSGDFIVICGETGCGKTTLLKMMKRGITPSGRSEGEIYYKGTLISDISPEAAACEIGYVSQDPQSQIVTDKVWHELAFGLENMGLPTQVIRRRTGEIAGFLGIEQWFRRDTDNLSGGQKQLLNLASVMVMQPEVLLLDEPTSQLDPIAASEFIGTLQKINRELGMTVILVEHRLEDVFPIADKVLLMDNGTVMMYDTPRNVALHLKEIDPGHPMLSALPSAVRIFAGLEAEGDCPLTVKEGRSFLSSFCRRSITADTSDDKDLAADKNGIAVELEDVWFRYEKDLPDIMRGVTFTAYAGQTYCILGGNGSGKTTALNVLCGINKAYRGSIRISGKKLKDYDPVDLYRNNIAYLPQNSSVVFVKDTVLEDFQEVCESMGYSDEYREEIIGGLVSTFRVGHLLDKHPYDLSGGEQQKCALCKLLLLKPRIILLDEPTKGFDSFAKTGLKKMICDLKSTGIAFIIVTHDVEFAAVNSDRCAMFFDGQIISEDTPQKFFSLNNFYTTAANRIARGIYPEAITCEDVIRACRKDRS